jgi:hypothetical protein
MASELRVDTLKSANGSNTVSTETLAEGSAKAWVNFDGTAVNGTVDLTGVRDSFNISAIVDNNTGDYRIDINADMNSTDYVVSGSGYDHAGTADSYTVHMYHDLAAGSVEINNIRPTNNASADTSYIGTTIHGDLA